MGPAPCPCTILSRWSQYQSRTHSRAVQIYHTFLVNNLFTFLFRKRLDVNHCFLHPCWRSMNTHQVCVYVVAKSSSKLLESSFQPYILYFMTNALKIQNIIFCTIRCFYLICTNLLLIDK